MFKDRLRSTRIEQHYTQQQIADAIGVTLRSYQRYESGHIEPPYQTLLALANFLNVSLDYLFCRDDFISSLENKA